MTRPLHMDKNLNSATLVYTLQALQRRSIRVPDAFRPAVTSLLRVTAASMSLPGQHQNAGSCCCHDRPMWGGKDSLRAAVWEVLKTEPEGLAAEDISRRVADGGYKLGGGSGTTEVRCQHGIRHKAKRYRKIIWPSCHVLPTRCHTTCTESKMCKQWPPAPARPCLRSACQCHARASLVLVVQLRQRGWQRAVPLWTGG